MRRAAAIGVLLLLGGCAAAGDMPAPRAMVADDVPLGALPRQALARGQCGLFLWRTGAAARLVLMARSGPPPFARLNLNGRLIDLPRLPDGATDATARYGDGRLTLAFDLAIERREGLSDGAVAGGSLRIDQRDGESFAVPVSGLLACG